MSGDPLGLTCPRGADKQSRTRDGKRFICAARLDRGTEFACSPATTQFTCLIVRVTIVLSFIRPQCFVPVPGIGLQWNSNEHPWYFAYPYMTLLWIAYMYSGIFTYA